jgi:hypothetical protein
MATLTRDQILGRALDMVASPALNNNDRPAGTIVSGALSAQWLQDALNLFGDEFPWAQLLTTAAIVIPTTAVLTLPSDFILDVRNGIYIAAGTSSASARRLVRTSYQKMLSYIVGTPGVGAPSRYTILPPNIRFWRTPDQSYPAVLAYYARQAVLTSSAVPIFPSDLPLIEYVRLRGLEWIRAVEMGSALKYVQKQIADLRKAGLAHEPEDDTIPFDPDQFIQMGDSGYLSWLGPFSNQL